jgi:hypothetical protein
MTAREYAKTVGIEIIGKLKKKIVSHERYDIKKDDFVEAKIVFYIDEVGNEFHKEKDAWCIITANGSCI